MRLAIGLCLLAGFLTSVQARYPEHFEWGSGDAMAFIGDETTYDGRWCQYVENYFITRYPDKRLVFYNAGCLNDTSEDVLARLEPDIIERKIDIALIMLGTFDAGFEDFDPSAFAAYQVNIRQLLDELSDRRIHPILVSPPMFDQRVHASRQKEDESYRFRLKPVAETYNGVMGYYTSWLREEAVRQNFRFVDAWGALNAATQQERKANPDFSLMANAVIPDAGGHAVIAAEVIDALAPERETLGSIRLYYRGPDKKWESRVDGGSLSQVSGSAKDVSFIWKAKSLPWVFPLDAVLGAQVVDVDSRFNAEMLHVVGLEEGDYELSIAGEKVGAESYHSRELAIGIALHELLDRPQYRRAEGVARKNAQRYTATVRPLRDYWQQLKRIRVNYPDEPEKYEEAFKTLEPKMNTLRQAARDLTDEIYKEAGPLGRSFEIRMIGEEE